MKTRSILFSMLFAASAFVLLANCSGNKKEEDHEHSGHDSSEHASEIPASKEASEPQFQVDATFQQQLSVVFTSYVDLKDAFVKSDAGLVKEEAKETTEALGKVDMKLVSGAAHSDWMNYLAPIQSS